LTSGRARRLRALVIQHEQPTAGGYLNRWLEERDADVDVLRIDIENREIEPREFDLIASLGSELAAFDDSIAWLQREKRLLLESVQADVPVLGVCFGGQLLARVLGGQSLQADRAEIGWMSLRTEDPSLVPDGPWFLWHFDTFTLPPGARLLADSPAGPQAYTIGRSFGIQFHPEVTPAIMAAWVAAYRHELDREGVDADRMLEETRRREGQSRAAAWRLFDAFLQRIAGTPLN
jgi:GMP synthase-like glutamine amidotransferase